MKSGEKYISKADGKQIELVEYGQHDIWTCKWKAHTGEWAYGIIEGIDVYYNFKKLDR